MSVIIFLIVIALLVFVHELGHFIAAKKLGARVDEFALGFPPRIWGTRRGETEYVINALPIGGYVKIFGEDPTAETLSGPDSSRSFSSRPKWAQSIILLAGVTGNILLAWLLFSLGFMVGMPTAIAPEDRASVSDPHVEIVAVVPGAPGPSAGLVPGDSIREVRSPSGDVLTGDALTPESVMNLIGKSADTPLAITYERKGEVTTIEVTPKTGILEDDQNRPAAGIVMALAGTVEYGPLRALKEGARLTAEKTWEVVVGLGSFLGSAFVLDANLSELTGPVGIVGLVGDASQLGIIYLLTFTAFISLNLAVINLLPFPALDGGRLLFVFIEALKGSPISPKIANALNGGGIILLLLLMAVVTLQDIIKLF